MSKYGFYNYWADREIRSQNDEVDYNEYETWDDGYSHDLFNLEDNDVVLVINYLTEVEDHEDGYCSEADVETGKYKKRKIIKITKNEGNYYLNNRKILFDKNNKIPLDQPIFDEIKNVLWQNGCSTGGSGYCYAEGTKYLNIIKIEIKTKYENKLIDIFQKKIFNTVQ